MLCATLLMLQPSIGRMQMPDTILGGELATLVAFLLATPLLAWDFVQLGRPHKATLLGLAALGAEQLFRLSVWQSDAWFRFAGTVVRGLT
jgi:hypothetical protein